MFAYVIVTPTRRTRRAVILPSPERLLLPTTHPAFLPRSRDTTGGAVTRALQPKSRSVRDYGGTNGGTRRAAVHVAPVPTPGKGRVYVVILQVARPTAHAGKRCCPRLLLSALVAAGAGLSLRPDGVAELIIQGGPSPADVGEGNRRCEARLSSSSFRSF